MEAYEDHTHSTHPHAPPSSHLHSPYEATLLAVDIFQKVEEEVGGAEGAVGEASSGGGAQGEGPGSQRSRFFINTAVELSMCWIRDTFDE